MKAGREEGSVLKLSTVESGFHCELVPPRPPAKDIDPRSPGRQTRHVNLIEIPDERMKRNLLIAVLILISIAALFAAGNLTGFFRSSELTLEITHWAAIVALVVYAAFRRTLGTWILVAMIVGAALGHDFPNFAVSLRILAQIFLRL